MRTAAFIDGGYLTYLLRDFGEPTIAFDRFAAELTGGDDLLRVYYYDCPPYKGPTPTSEESERFAAKERFFHALSRLNRFTVRQGKLAFRGHDRATGRPIFIQKRVDIMLAVDLVLLSTKRQIWRAALVTGDSDFLPAVEVAKNEGVLVHLYHGAGDSRPHRDLWDAVDDRTLIDEELIGRVRS